MYTRIAAAVLACSMVLLVGLDVAGAEDNGAVFVADFDGTVVARGAHGEEIPPLKAEGVKFADGVKDQALYADGCVVTYPTDVLPKDAGTLVICLSPLPEPAGEEFTHWRVYFGDADEWGPLGTPHLWLFGSVFRFDMDGGRWMRPSVPADAAWYEGTWHQLAAVWERRGKIALYFDGKPIAEKVVRSWEALPRTAFAIGGGRPMSNRGWLSAHALIDNVRIYDRALTADEIKTSYLVAGIAGLKLSLPQTVFEPPATDVPVVVTNTGGDRWQGALNWTCGEQRGKLELDLGPEEARTVVINDAVAPDTIGLVRLVVKWHEGLDYDRARSQELTAYVAAPLGPPPDEVPEWKLVATVDCAEEPPVSEVGQSRVIEGSVGRYREAAPERYSRFAYVFRVSAPDRLVRLTLEHPDDKTHATSVAISTPTGQSGPIAGAEGQVLGNGLLSGVFFKLSNAMEQRQYVFPATCEHLAIIIETGATGEPAAAARLTLEDAAPGGYGPAWPGPALQARKHRRMGLYWEDPVLGQDFGWTGTDYPRWDDSLERALNYMAWSGQDTIAYPTVWYQGPVYRSRCERGTWPYGGRHHPPDYPRLMAIRCAERGTDFIPTFTIWSLPSLQHLIVPADRMIAGETAVNTVTREGKVLTSTNWGSPPLLNAQHADVQEALLELVDEHVAMCGDQPSFAGIEFALWPSSPMQAGAKLFTSYDDWTVGEFARHIGQVPPGEPSSAERFKQRADWILNDSDRRAAWVRWRCEKMTQFYNEVARHLARAGAHCKLRLVVLQPGPDPNTDPAQALLEQGLDLEALSRNPQIVIARHTNQTACRCERCDDPDWDAVELTRWFQKPFYGLPRTSATIHQQYFESHVVLGWGSRAPKLKLPKPWVREALGRCCQPVPAGRNFLRHPALDLYLLDAQRLAIGGFNLGTLGFENEVREFGTAFRALPAVPFTDLGCTGPIVVRRAEAEGYQWIYALNITDREARLSLRVQGGVLREAVSGAEVAAPLGHAEFTLRAYELRVWRTSPDAQVSLRSRQRPLVDTGLGVKGAPPPVPPGPD